MAQSAADEESSPAPTITEGGTPAAVHEGVGGKEMVAADVAAVDVPDEVEPAEAAGAEPEEEEEEEPEKTTEDDPEEEEEEDPEEEGEDEGEEEEEEEGGNEETMMGPLAMVKPGEVQEEDEEPSEADEESEEAAPEEEPEEVGEGAEGGDGMAEDAVKSSAEGLAVDDMNKLPKEKPGEFGGAGKHDVNNKDGVADQLSNGVDAGGSRNCDAKNDELAGGLEVFVDELPTDCVEGDIAMVLSQCGEIKSVRIIRNSSTGKSKDIAFVCYANIEAVRNALTEFVKGIEVKGKKVKVSACEDNNTLYLGNICKSWTKDQVMNTLKSMGIGQFKVDLPTDKKGRGRGFAFLEFSSHYYARAAFRRLMRPDAAFGIDRSAKVSFARTPTKPTDEFLMEVKTVYLEHIPLSWDEEKIKESCRGYGKIQNVNIFQISEKKTFSFVEFSSSKSASACVEGINRAKIVDGDFMLSASLARPKGGLKVISGVASEDAKTSKKKKDHRDGVVLKNSPHKLPINNKSKLTSQTKRGIVRKSSSNKWPIGNESKHSSQVAADVPHTSNPSKGKRTVVNIKNTSFDQGPSKKAQGNIDESKLTYQGAAEVPQSSSLSKGKRKAGKNRNTYVNERPSKKARNSCNLLTRASNTAHPGDYARGTGNPAGPRYASDAQDYPSVRATSRSKVHASDLEPHAGYIPPVDRVHSTHVSTRYNVHQTDAPRYARETAAPRPAYSGYTSHDGYQAEYAYIYPPPSISGSYYRGSGPYITRRGDY